MPEEPSSTTGVHRAQSEDGSISAGALKTIATVVSLVVVLASAVAWASSLRAEVVAFREQYSRDASSMLRRLDAADDARERVRVLEAQRLQDEREWRSRGEAIERRVTEIETQMRGLLTRPQ